MAKIRYSHKGAPCLIREQEDGTVECQFETPQRAITRDRPWYFMKMIIYSEEGPSCERTYKKGGNSSACFLCAPWGRLFFPAAAA